MPERHATRLQIPVKRCRVLRLTGRVTQELLTGGAYRLELGARWQNSPGLLHQTVVVPPRTRDLWQSGGRDRGRTCTNFFTGS